MKVAITGISSYLAAELYPLLRNDAEIDEIIGIDITEPKIKDERLNFVRKDVRDPSLQGDLQDCDALIHLAFVVSPLKDEEEMYSVNIDGSKNTFNCAIKARVRKIIHASSVAAYGSFEDNPIPITEEHPIRLMDKPYYYHETKYRVEKFLDKLEERSPDVIFTRFRPHIFLGEQINNFFGNLFQNEKIYSFLPENPSQYLWAKDVASAFHLALKNDAPGAFNLGGDNPLSTIEIAERLDKKLINLPYRLVLFAMTILRKLGIYVADPGWVRMAKYPIVVDSSKAKRVLGWEPQYDTFGAVKAFLNGTSREKER